MLTVRDTEVAGWVAALGGMRNPLNSWDRADSTYVQIDWLDDKTRPYALSKLGPNDRDLMERLLKPGTSDHCKFRRMLVIYANVMAPLYWWKEMDTYKVGTVANSCSTMHTLANEPFDLDMFSHDHLLPGGVEVLNSTIDELNTCRRCYLESKAYAKEYAEKGNEWLAKDHQAKAESWWYSMIQLLPSSFNQFRTIEFNYEVMASIYRQRKNHKLKEWHEFIDAMVSTLPHPWIFTGEGVK